MTYIDSEGIFGICRVNLHNRILISTWLDDLKFSASSSVEAETLRPSRSANFGLRGLKFCMRYPGSPPQLGLSVPADIQKKYYRHVTLKSIIEVVVDVVGQNKAFCRKHFLPQKFPLDM